MYIKGSKKMNVLGVIFVELFIIQQIFSGISINSLVNMSDSYQESARRLRSAEFVLDDTIDPETASEIELEQAVQNIFSQIGDLGEFGFDINTAEQRVIFSRPATADYDRALGEAWFDGELVHLKTVDLESNVIEHKVYDKEGRRIVGFKKVMLVDGNSHVITCEVLDEQAEDFDFKFAVYKGENVFEAEKNDISLGLPDAEVEGVERDVIVRGNEYTIRIPNLQAAVAADIRGDVPDELNLTYKIEEIAEGKWQTTITVNGEEMGVVETNEEPVISTLQLGFDPDKIEGLKFVDEGILREIPVLSNEALVEMVNIIEAGMKEDAIQEFTAKHSLMFKGCVASFKALAFTLMGAEVAAWVSTKTPLLDLMGRSGAFANIPLLVAQSAIMVPLLMTVAKYGVKSFQSTLLDRSSYEIDGDVEVLEHRFSDQGFDEGVAVMYTAYFGTGPEAKAKADKCIRNIARTIEGNISDNPEENKNLYFIFVSDDYNNPDTMLYLLEKFDELFKQYGDKVNLLFTSRERAQQVGWKWGAQWDVMGMMTSLKEHPNATTRLYSPLTFSDQSVHSIYARDPEMPVFGLPGGVIKEAAGKGASGMSRVLTFDHGVAERQLKATGWMWTGPTLDPSTGIDSLVGQDAIQHLLVLDEGDVIGVNQVVEWAAKVRTAMESEEFSDVSIFLPEVQVANPSSSGFTEFASSAQERFGWSDLATFRTRKYVQASGKMWIKINDYVDEMMQPGEEGLGAHNTSHDYLESLRLRTIRLLGILCYDSRPSTIDADDDYITQLTRWVKGDLTSLFRNIWGRHEVMQNILHGLAGENLRIPGMEMPDDPEWNAAMKETMADIQWFITGNLLYGSLLGFTLTTSAVSTAMGQTNPALSFAMLGLVLGAQLVGGPLLLAPTVQRIKDRNLERLEQAAEDVEQGLWDRVKNSLPAIVAEEMGRGMHDWARSLLYVMPLMPLFFPMVLLNGKELISEYQIEAAFAEKIEKGLTRQQALSEIAFEMNNKWTNQFMNFGRRMLGKPEQTVAPGDVVGLGKIAWRGAKIPAWARTLYRGISPVIGAGIFGGLYASGISPDTAGGIASYAAAATIAVPFMLYPITTALLSRFNNTKYMTAIAQTETEFGDNFKVGWAFNRAHEANNYDYSSRVRTLVQQLNRGNSITDIWDNVLTEVEIENLIEEFSNRINAETALKIYLNDIRAYLGG